MLRPHHSLARPISPLLAALLVLPALLLLSSRLAADGGVTLFSERGSKGASQTFFDDVPDLRYSGFGGRPARSIAVSPGCFAILYQQPLYEGRSTVFREDGADLARTALGSATASSIRVGCDGGAGGVDAWKAGRPGARGVTLYRGSDLAGPNETFEADVPNLDRSRFGARMARSLALAPGCAATLFEQPNYKGASKEYAESAPRMGDAANRASSLRLACGPGLAGSPDAAPPAAAPVPVPRAATPSPLPPLMTLPEGRKLGVTLYRSPKMKGKGETLYEDTADLSRHPIGARTARAIWVPRGCEATLFQQPHFKGKSQVFRDSNPNLKGSTVGEAASSIKVTCLQP